jgi:gliding motility-associated-like protein
VNAGSAPQFNWMINGVAAGTNDSVFTATALNDNDVIMVVASSSLTCAPVSSDTDAVTITVAGTTTPSLNVTAVSSGICEGSPVQFIAHGANSGPTPAFQWFVNGMSTGQTNDTVVMTTLTQGDTVTAVMTSSLACVSPSSITSSPYISTLKPFVTPQVSINMNPSDSVCVGQQVVLTASTMNGGTAPVINWFVNGIQNSNTSDTFTSSAFGQGDVIVARLTSNEDCLTRLSDTSNFVRILYRSPLSVTLIADSARCPGDSALIVAQPAGGNGGPYQIYWSTGDINTDSIIITPGPNTQVVIQVVDNCTAMPGIDTLDVPVMTGPVANFSYANASPGSFQNKIQFMNLSTNADMWTWFFPDSGTTSADLNPLHEFPGEGSYDIMLATQNINGCVDTIVYTVTVLEEIAVYYPNSFSPNGDGLNETFRPLGASLDHYEMTIWNRWGELIFTGNELIAWNGHIGSSGQPAPEGVYVYRIDLMGDRFDKRVVTGRVTLIR